MKQVSHPPLMGIVDDKKWCPFFCQASKDPIFYTPKRPFSVILGAKKKGLWTPESVFIGFLQGSEAGVTLDQLMKQLKATTDYFQE